MTATSASTTSDIDNSHVMGVDGWLFLAGVALVPLSNILPIGVGRLSPSDVLWVLLVSILVQLRGRELWPYIYRNPVLIPVVIIVGYMVITGVLGSPPSGAGHAVLQAASLGFYLLLILPIFAYYGQYTKAVWGILVGWVLFDAVLLLLGLIGVPYTGFDTGSGRFYTILTPVGTLASNAAAISPLFVFAAILQRRLWGVIGIAASVFIISMDKSRTATLVFAIMFFYVLVVSQLLAGRAGRGGVKRLAYAGIALVILIGAALAFSSNQRYATLGAISEDGIGAVDLKRVLGYKMAIDGVIDHPLLGGGFQSTRTVLDATTITGTSEWEEVVHNGYLQLSADLGVPAGLALLSLLLIPLVRTGRTIRQCLRADIADIDQEQLIMESVAFFVVFALAVKLCFHPLGLVIHDWIFFLAAAPRYYWSSHNRCLRRDYGR